MTRDNHQGKGRKPDRGQPVVGRPSYLRGRSRFPEAAEKDEVQLTEEKVDEINKVEEAKQEDTELYSWSIWLYPRRPFLSAFVTITMAGVLVVSYIVFPSKIFILFGALLLFNRLSQYLFPIKYTLTEYTVGYSSLFARDKREWINFYLQGVS